ncbi:flagellar biosynthesis anti-sigma factor FlgM [Nitrospira lenta]|uniref:Negative regulator of flagellin synthesis n=1 Tax=Nitrospira lenta TaxID=1436998 RepID=A0A330L7F6_9BACT|nr:flagellar biosynthesis anti-sigma factor FlgM [Nitrospira lenta]SPP65181.1 Anti-sigma 28 factor FlgM [Nitrospira lenta]
MQISGSGRSDQLAKILLGTQETKGPSPQPQSSQKEAGNDRVQISDQAKELQRIRALGQTPDQERAARVEQIKNALEHGTYDVSGRKVGDALIKQVLTDAVL